VVLRLRVTLRLEIRLDMGGCAVAQPVRLALGHDAESPGFAGLSGMIGKAGFEGTGDPPYSPYPPEGAEVQHRARAQRRSQRKGKGWIFQKIRFAFWAFKV
jgi:hypothetical protein